MFDPIACEVAKLIGSKPNLVDYWREPGLSKGTRRNEKHEYYHERRTTETIQRLKNRCRLPAPTVATQTVRKRRSKKPTP